MHHLLSIQSIFVGNDSIYANRRSRNTFAVFSFGDLIWSDIDFDLCLISLKLAHDAQLLVGWTFAKVLAVIMAPRR